MSTITATAPAGNSFWTRLREYMGFPPAVIPFIVALGIAYLMLTLPQLFEIGSRLVSGPGYAHATFSFLWERAQSWQGGVQAASYNWFGAWVLRLSIVAIPALWLAALIRSAVVRSGRPFVITALASLLGALGIPIVAWVAELVMLIFHVIDIVVEFIATYILPWVLRIGFWLVVVALGVGALVGLYVFIAYIAKERRWLKILISIAVVALLAVVIRLGWLDWLLAALHWLGVWIARVAGWVGAFLGLILGWILKAIVVTLIFLLVLGLAVAFFGEIGRQILIPFRSAPSAGTNAARCADVAAGTGVAMSVVLTAAVLDTRFQDWFRQVWHSTPLLKLVPDPIGGYAFILPNAAERVLRLAFVGYAPIVEIAIVVLVAAIGVLSLLFAPARWIPGDGSRVVRPVLFAVGGAIAVAVIFIALAILAALLGGLANSS